MEKRLLFAIVLSFLVIFLYQAVFMKRPPQTELPQDTPMELSQEPEQAPSEPTPMQAKPIPSPEVPSQKDFIPTSEHIEEKIVDYRMNFSGGQRGWQY